MATKNRGRIRTPYKCSLSPEFLQLFPYSLFRFSSLDLTPYNYPPILCPLSPLFSWFPTQISPYSLSPFSSLDLTPYNCPPIVCPPSPLLTWFPTTFPLFFVPLLLSWPDSLYKYPLFFVPLLPSPKDYSHLFNVPRNEAARTCSGWGMFRLPSF